MYVGELSLYRKRSESVKSFSICLPLRLYSGLPHRGLWPLKSPSRRKGLGSCRRSWLRLGIEIGMDGGRYIEQIVITVDDVILTAIACKGVSKCICLWIVFSLIYKEEPPCRPSCPRL